MQCGWYKEVQVKSVSCHEIRAVLNSRAQLVKIKRDLENQIRGLLKNLGLVIGKAGGNVFGRRVEVYAKPPLAGPEQVIAYLARYTHRVALSNDRLLSLHDDQVCFRWRDYRDGAKSKLMRLEAGEFIRRFLIHVLPPGFMRIRHYGLFANRQRRHKLARCRELLSQPAPQPRAEQSVEEIMLRLTGRTEHPAVVEKVARYVAIHRELKSEPRGPRRCALVRESFALKTTLMP